MASDINSVFLIGRLTRDMETKYTNGGMAIGNFSIAVNRRVKRGDEWQDEGNFFDAAIFGKTAEALGKYLVKGQQVAIEGELKQDRWEQDGQKRSKVSIAVQTVQLLGGKKDGDQGSGYSAPEPQTYTGGFSDDIPF